MKSTKAEDRLRPGLGVALLLLALALPLSGLALSLLGWRGAQSPLIAFLLVGGLPEILCLLAIAILGKRFFDSRLRIPAHLAAPASRVRYYAGLLGCLLNGVPVWIYAYFPGILPEGENKYYILVAADLVFFYSLFLAGGEFWEKFRRLFVWEGEHHS